MDDLSVIKNEDYVGKHTFLSESLLIPNANKTDANRIQMVESHITQARTVKDAEPPLIFSGFENQVGEYSTGYKELTGNYTILKKIHKNKYTYLMFIKDNVTGIHDVIYRNECFWLTEHYGYKFNNGLIDSLEPGDELEDSTILYKNDNYDENMNFQYGTNLNTVYLAYKGLTFEDAVPISQTGANKLKTYSVKKVIANVNTNDILINLCGDDDNYKSFPDIGEDIENQTLLSSRRINYETLLYELKDLREIRDNDTVLYSNGKIIDINIFCNEDIEKLKDQDYSKQIVYYIEKQNSYYKEVVDYLKPIIENKEGLKVFSHELLYLYNRYKMILDNNRFTYQSNKFDNYVIEFTILEEEELHVGSKITGRYGNKGIISAIIPDNEMPVIESGPFKGQFAEVCLNPGGVINRLNPALLIEIELNFISKYVRLRMKNNPDKCEDIITEYYKNIGELQYNKFINYLKTISDSEKRELFNEFIENGIPIEQPPFWNNVNINKLSELYDIYDEVEEFRFKNIENPLIMAEMYFMRLKHEPINKTSARSTSLNNLKDFPSKVKSYKEYKDLHSKTPIRWGEMEIANSTLVGDIEPIKEILDSYANNETDRKRLLEAMLTSDPFDIDYTPSGTKSNNSKIIDTFFKCLGLELED